MKKLIALIFTLVGCSSSTIRPSMLEETDSNHKATYQVEFIITCTDIKDCVKRAQQSCPTTGYNITTYWVSQDDVLIRAVCK